MQTPVQSQFVIDADDTTFADIAIRGSMQQPVVVDFWAEWCGPCRALGPLLEALAEEFAGAFLLVKVDTEAAPQVSQQFNIRSIPAVVGIRDGEIIAEFVGAQPEAAVREFLAKLIPSPAEVQIGVARNLRAEGSTSEAEQAFRTALELEPGHPVASHDLGLMLFERGDLSAASELAESARLGTAMDPEIERLKTAIRVRDSGDGDLASLEAEIANAPDDPGTRIKLAAALAAQERHEEALSAYLEVVKRAPDYEDQAARRAMLDLFEVLGSDHDITRDFRAQLARLLYR
jgi:putative thioredoxin